MGPLFDVIKLIFNSGWSSLPDMTDFRAGHACARIKRSGRDYLVALGGLYGPNMTLTNTIEFYDLTLKPGSWEFMPGITFPQSVEFIGWKITVFDEGICEAFFIDRNGKGFVCTGNYTWTSNFLPSYQNGFYVYPVVDANLVGGDTVW
jgi:hypothetical protein